MKKNIFKIMLLGGVIFGACQANASTIAEETPVVQEKVMPPTRDPRVTCMIEVLIRSEAMEGHYSPETIDRIVDTEMGKCADGTHSSL